MGTNTYPENRIQQFKARIRSQWFDELIHVDVHVRSGQAEFKDRDIFAVRPHVEDHRGFVASLGHREW
jgi:hypothetical protein